LGLDGGDGLGRPVVVLDEVGLVLAHPEGERQVALREAQRSNRAACPWPTPTQRVARPQGVACDAAWRPRRLCRRGRLIGLAVRTVRLDLARRRRTAWRGQTGRRGGA